MDTDATLNECQLNIEVLMNFQPWPESNHSKQIPRSQACFTYHMTAISKKCSVWVESACPLPAVRRKVVGHPNPDKPPTRLLALPTASGRAVRGRGGGGEHGEEEAGRKRWRRRGSGKEKGEAQLGRR